MGILYSADTKRQVKAKTDPECVKKIRDYYFIVYVDEHGLPTMQKEEFYDGLRIFLRDQERVYRDLNTKDTGEIIILEDKTEEFDQFVKTEGKSAGKSNRLEQDLDELGDKDPMNELKKQLMQNKVQAEALLASGKVKDEIRRTSIKQMINGFNKQIRELEDQ